MLILHLLASVLSICVLVVSTHVSSAVLELNEKFLDVKHEGQWFVEFYAPWCGHCKRLHPTWEQVGHILASSPVRVARVDCTRYTDVASQLNIQGFPTIKYFRNGVEFTYDGDRTKEAIVDFAWKALGPEVREIEGVERFQQEYNSHYVGGFFMFVAEKSDSSELKKNYQEVATQLFTKAYFFSTSPESLTKNISVSSPAVVIFKDDAYYEYDGTKPLAEWVETERWLRLPLVTYGNLNDIGLCCNKLLVLAVLDYVKRKKEPVTKKFYETVDKTAKRYKDRLHQHFQFGWLDGSEIASSIAATSVPIPSLIVFNATSHQYYVFGDSPEETTEESILLFLENIQSGSLLAAGGRGILQRFRRGIFEFYSFIYGVFASQPLLACCLFGLPLGILSVICYTLCSSDVGIDHDEVYPESDESDDNHEKDD